MTSYFFIGDLIENKLDSPITLFDNYKLQRASSDQQIFIKDFINRFLETSVLGINKYESSYSKHETGVKIIQNINPNDWRYSIIENSKTSNTEDIRLTFALCRLDLTIIMEVDYNIRPTSSNGNIVPATAHQPIEVYNYYQEDWNLTEPIRKTLTTLDVEEIKNIHDLISKFDRNNYSFIDKALSDFLQIVQIPATSPFRILGYFSILELLLTTFNSGSDKSISHQLKKKIVLLNNYSKTQIEISDYFKGSDTNTLETVMGKLYDYRNDIAHGNIVDFDKNLAIFTNQFHMIQPFLRNLLKQILILSLEQPQLIRDLKQL